MPRASLFEMRPPICGFRQVFGGAVNPGIYRKRDTGRPSDALIYILKGTTHYDFGDYALEAKPGDLLFLAKGSRYSMDVHDRYAFLFANFDFLLPEGTALQCSVVPAPGAGKTEATFQRMLTVWRVRHSAAAEECTGLLYSVYADFLRASEAAYFPSAQRKRIDDAVDYIAKHLTEESLNVGAVAAHVHLSESYFRRAFKAQHHLSPIEYIRMRRITLAKERIRLTDMTFTAIAEELGFSSVYYFSAAFKKEAGCTPSEYRSRHSPYP